MISKLSSGIGICFILVSAIFVTKCTGQLWFYRNNTCGCFLNYYCGFDCDTCTISEPTCSLNDLLFEEFEPENLEDCNQWFLEGYNLTLINRRDGTINVALLLSPSSPKKIRIRYKVDLKMFENSTEEVNHPTENVILPNHSTKYVKVNNVTKCKTVLPIEFNFLFSGTYQLEISEDDKYSKSMRCRSKPFHIYSQYTQRKLNELQPSYTSRYRAQNQELVLHSYFGNFSAGYHPHSTIVMLKSHIDVSLRDCAGSGNEVAKYILHEKTGVCCDCHDMNDTNGLCDKQGVCPCKWNSKLEELECTFRNITNGDYCVIVQFYDPRCAADTIWTKNGHCAWSYNETARGDISPTSVKVRLENTISKWFISLTLLFIVIIVMVCAAVYKYKPKCFKKLTHGLNNYTPPNLMTPPTETPTIPWLISNRDECEKFLTPEVLLLYPRDCEPFMKAMEAFRTHLKNSNLKVFDPWDEEIYDEVVESCETWTLPFIKNKNVKIIIVLTECSKKYEKAFLENSILEYAEPRALDTIFTQSISNIHQYFSKRFDSYQRLFVARLDGSSITNFDFITPATVYSIPKNIDLLTVDITSGNLNETNLHSSMKLTDAVEEYENYRKKSSDYLTDLLRPKKLNGT